MKTSKIFLRKVSSTIKHYTSTFLQLNSVASREMTPYLGGIDFSVEFMEVAAGPIFSIRQTLNELSIRLNMQLKRPWFKVWIILTYALYIMLMIITSVLLAMNLFQKMILKLICSSRLKWMRKEVNFILWSENHQKCFLEFMFLSGVKYRQTFQLTGPNTSIFVEERREFKQELAKKTMLLEIRPSIASWLSKSSKIDKYIFKIES